MKRNVSYIFVPSILPVKNVNNCASRGKNYFPLNGKKLNFNSVSLLENFICCTDGQTEGRTFSQGEG